MVFSPRSLLLAGLAIVPAIASPVYELVKGVPLPICNHDNLYRLFIDTRYSVSASQFCSVYIASTTIARTTTTPIVTVTSTPTAYATSTPTSITSITVPTTVTTVFVTSTETDAATVTVTDLEAAREAKKAVKAGRDALSITAPDMAMTYGSSRLSSACSCLVTPSTVTVSTTATAATKSSTAIAATTTVTVTAATVFTTVAFLSSVSETESATTTTTTTSFATSYITAPSLCNNAGLQFAVYSNPYSNNVDYYTYPNYDPTYLKTQTPELTGTTDTIGIQFSGGDVSVYDSDQTVDLQQASINHRGYVYATQTGTYTFAFGGNTDDITILWVGSIAYSGWDRPNESAEEVYDGITPAFQVPLVIGQYYPIRIIWANSLNPGTLTISITAPDGTVILGPDSGPVIDVVQFSCDGITAPQYQPFGSET